MDAYYYESSVLVPHGIDTVFTNVIRAALINKREKHFWNMLGGLKRITRPICQKPHLPPKPAAPVPKLPVSHHQEDLGSLLQNQAYCDVIFVAQGVCIQAHKAVLLAAAPVFEDLFLLDMSSSKPAAMQRVNSQKEGAGTGAKPDTDTSKLLENEEYETCSIDTADGMHVHDASEPPLPRQVLNHPAFHCIELQHCEDVTATGQKVLQTVVTLDGSITPAAFQVVLFFLYTGRCVENYDALPNVKYVGELLGLKDLSLIATSLQEGEGFLVGEVERKFQRQKCQRMKELLIERGLLSGWWSCPNTWLLKLTLVLVDKEGLMKVHSFHFSLKPITV